MSREVGQSADRWEAAECTATSLSVLVLEPVRKCFSAFGVDGEDLLVGPLGLRVRLLIEPSCGKSGPSRKSIGGMTDGTQRPPQRVSSSQTSLPRPRPPVIPRRPQQWHRLASSQQRRLARDAAPRSADSKTRRHRQAGEHYIHGSSRSECNRRSLCDGTSQARRTASCRSRRGYRTTRAKPISVAAPAIQCAILAADKL